MLRLLKLCLVWLMLLALPVQGSAAVLQAACGSGQGRVVSKPTAVKPRAVHERGSKAARPARHGQDHDGSECRLGCDCCVGGAAMPAAMRPGAASAALAAPVFTHPLALSAHIPDGIERPPRPISG